MPLQFATFLLEEQAGIAYCNPYGVNYRSSLRLKNALRPAEGIY
ncbi:MAG: hypothetical protein ACUVUU_02740 [bacterium]